MKTFYTLLIILIPFLVLSQQSPCVPDESLQDSTFGLWPDTIQNLPIVQLGTYYEEYIQIKTPATVGEVMGDPYEIEVLGFPVNFAPLEIDSFKLVGITGLPNSFNYEFSNSDGIYYQNNVGCIKIFGTAENEDIGNYDLSISIDSWINVSVIGTVSLSEQLGYYESIDGYNLIISQSFGCTDINACNFDENATLDDGSCNYPSASELFIESCENIEWNGMLLDETGLYNYVTTNSNGCDSTVLLDFTLFNSNFSIDNISSCESFVFNDIEYTESGMYTFEGINSNGCDSTVIIDLTIFESISENIIYGNPEPDPFSVSLYSASNNENNLIWSVEGGNIIENNGNSINIQWGNQGIGLITLIESNDICDDFTNVFTVNIGGQIEPTWDCNNDYACVELSDGSGNFQSLEECEANCSSVESTWDCNDNFACIEQSDGSGNFQSLEECEANCGPVEPTWDCNNDYACVELSDGSGNFQSLEECEANCSSVEPTWDCNDNFACIEQSDGSGNFQSLEECEANCSPVEPTWDCNNDYACVELSDGSGNFQSLEECEANCSSVEPTFNCIFPLNNGDGYCDELLDGTGEFSTLEDCEQECQNVSSINQNIIDVNIYPNPSSNIFNLEFNSNYETEISVTNVLGEQVYFESVQSVGKFNTQIDLSKYSKGIYNLTLKTSDGISNHKLILQ